jgi:hypothetical protein
MTQFLFSQIVDIMLLKPGKIATRLIVAAAILVLAIFLSISPVAKYLIEKNAEKWTGRRITMNSLFINLLNWNVTLKGLKVYEYRQKEVFFSVSRLHVELSLLNLMRGGYVIRTVQLESPAVMIEQKGEQFNFDDLVKRFATEDTLIKKPESPSEPFKYRIEAIAVKGGRISYRDKLLNHEIVLNNLNFSCPLLAYDENKIHSLVGFSVKSGGTVLCSLNFNQKSHTYTLDAKLDKLNLHFLQPYLKDYLKTSYAGGLLSTDLLINGNFDKPEAIAIHGDIGISNFRLDDLRKLTVASLKNFTVRIDTINVASDIYHFGKIVLDEPTLLFEIYTDADNFTRMMLPSSGETADSSAVDSVDYSNPFTIMAGYIKTISRTYVVSNYTVSSAEIHKGNIVYNDYSLDDRFTYDLEEFELSSGRIDSHGDSITFSMSCLANRLGRLNAYLAFDPKDYKNMSINYTVDKMRISDFNPYSRFYVAHAFVEGLLHYASTNTIHEGILASTNVMHIDKIEVSRRLPHKGLYSMPLRLAIVLLRDRHGNIDLDIPVQGDLNDPTYKLWKTIWRLLGNLVVKAAVAPYTMLSAAIGSNEEELKSIPFDYLQQSLDDRQLKRLDLVSQSLESKPGLKVSIIQIASHENEKEALALYLTKKQYYLENILKVAKDSLSKDDIKAISVIPNTDSLYNAWLDNKLIHNDLKGLPAQLKSRQMKGEEWLGQQVDLLFEMRNRFVLNYLLEIKKINPLLVKIGNTTDEKSARFESSPKYNIDFMVEE